MLEVFNSETKELLATNQYMQTYIGTFKKERAAYPEHKTLHYKNVTYITVDSDSITPQKKNGRKEYFQEDLQITFGGNE